MGIIDYSIHKTIGDRTMDALFYVRYNGKAKGPFTFAQLQHFAGTNQITRETPVLIKDQTEWKPAEQIPGIFPQVDYQLDGQPDVDNSLESPQETVKQPPTGTAEQTASVPEPAKEEKPKKERAQAIVLAIFLGWFFGAHRTYLGKDSAFQVAVPLVGAVVWFVFFLIFIGMESSVLAIAIVTVLCIMFTFGIMEAFSLADAIKLLLMTDEKFDELYN